MKLKPGATARETRVGAVLFTDLVGFTEFTDAVGDVAALEVLETQLRLVGSVLDSTPDARIVKDMGDGLMLWFGSAADGLAGAIDLLVAIEAARDEGLFPLAVRMGLHHGEAIARGDDLVGRTVNIAARVADLAGPGELLVSEDALDVAGRLPSDLGLQAIGPAAVKGVRDPIWLHLLTR